MLQEMVHPQDQQLSIEEISHLLEFSESSLFPETVQNSEVGSSSNCSYDQMAASVPINIILEDEDHNIAIDFSTSPSLSHANGCSWPPYEEECMSSFMTVPYLGMLPCQSQDLEFQGDNSAFDNMQTLFNCSTDIQGLSNESQNLYHGGASATSTLASEISSPTFKVGKISVEERKRKIHRYLKKRNQRNFSKKIKYACRKTLADSRPRVRGRFAKNDELGQVVGRHMGNNHEDDVDEDVRLYSNSILDHQRKVVVKEEDDLDSSDILAHISGVNSFKCNYPIQSWI